MVEYTVKYHADSFFVQIAAYICEILICTQAGINLCIIPGIVSMCVRLKYRRKINGIGP